MQRNFLRSNLALLLATFLPAIVGCHETHHDGGPMPPIGVEVDQIMRTQEDNAESAKFIVYQHEFEQMKYVEGRPVGGYRLTPYGEDHVKQIAGRLREGVPFPVVVERSQTSPLPNTKYKYPIHFNPELDMQRREVLVRSLAAMGVPAPETRVVVAPSFAQGLTASEAQAAYQRGLNNRGNGGGFGFGGFGGLGGVGFGGGFGGGGGGF